MTIKEIEEKSGMLRANIRFYESEGFLNPEREKNGYRNYSEEDLQLLRKIKLLRSLHISLEEIKAMHQGEQELGEALEVHIETLAKQQEELEKSKYVCEKMKRDGATYEKLNTEQYLLVLKNCRPNVMEREEWKERDVAEPVRAPFLRMFARAFDYLFYMLLWMLLVMLWNRLTGLSKSGVLIGTVSALAMAQPLAVLLEPIFLHCFGATPGKMLLGLSVTYDLGGRIPLDMAWARSWRAVFGVHDWRYKDLFQMLRIFKAMDEGKPLDWDYEANTTLELKDEKPWRKLVLAAAAAVCIFAMALAYRSMQMLPNRGDVTAGEFAENYNARIDFVYGGGTKISKTGEWLPERNSVNISGGNYFTMTAGGESRRFEHGSGPKKIDIIEENGIVTEVGFFYETRNSKEYLEDYRDLMFDLAMTFLEAQGDYSVFTYGQWQEVGRQVSAALKPDPLAYVNQYPYFKDFTYTIEGVTITCDVELQGYELWQNRYVAKDGAETYYSVRFSIAVR